MNYYVVSGQQIHGPVDLAELEQWRAQGRVWPDTVIKDSTGRQFLASEILQFPPDPQNFSPRSPSSSPFGIRQGPFGQSPEDPGLGSYGGQYPNQPFNPNYSPYASYPRQSYGSSGNGTSFFVASLLFSTLGCGCCWVLGPIIGLILGYMAKRDGYPSATVAIVVGWVFLALSLGLLLLRFGN